MKKISLLLIFSLVAFQSNAQNVSVNIAHKKPYKYEKRNGNLEVLVSVSLETNPRETIKVLLDGRQMDIQDVSEDGIDVWLPLIGDKKHLEVYTGKKLNSVVSQLYSPLIPEDWGYFQNGTIHIISSSHQDIGWMDEIDICREDRIYNIINPALEMMKKDSDYAFGMEQTLNLMEFLEEFPDRKDEIIQHYKEGRFIWGATYNQPYEGLESGEQLVRQAYYGRKWIKENLPGCDDITACNVDVPGRTWQMPQILAKSGIQNLFISRNNAGLFNWKAPDGTKIFTFSLAHYYFASYRNLLPDNAVTGFSRIHGRVQLWNDYFKDQNIPPHYAVVKSTDAEKPSNYREVVDEWNNIVSLSDIPLPRIKHSTFETYFSQVNVPGVRVKDIEGERPGLWLYIHGPAHYQAIKAKREAGVLLPAAEMFTTFNCVLENDLETYPRKQFDEAWMASIYPDHGWGGKGGHITDSIFRASLEHARDMGKELLDKSLVSISKKVNTRKNAMIVFNDLSWPRTDLVTFEIDEKQAKNIAIKDESGKQIPVQVRKTKKGYEAVYIAENVPSLGYKTYYIHSGKRLEMPQSVTQYSNHCENEFYKITLGKGGIESLYDKQLKKELLNTSRLSGGDVFNAKYTGNGAGEFTQIVDLTLGGISAISSLPTQWEVIESGPLFTTYENVQEEMQNAKVIQRICVYHEIKKIDLDITLVGFDGEHNRQFRMAMPLNMRKDAAMINYEVPMGILQVGRDELKAPAKGTSARGTYRQFPEEVNPREIQNFISANGNGFGLTLSSPVAVADWIEPPTSSGSEDPVVLQGVLLSSHKSCHGAGNWYSQEGDHNYVFSVLSHDEGWENGYHFGIEANHPLRAIIKTENNKGTLPGEMSFMAISDPFVQVTTIKKSDADNGIIVRMTEMAGKDSNVKIELPLPVSQIIETSLIEEEKAPVSAKGNSFVLPMGHHSIDTYKFKF